MIVGQFPAPGRDDADLHALENCLYLIQEALLAHPGRVKCGNMGEPTRPCPSCNEYANDYYYVWRNEMVRIRLEQKLGVLPLYP
jgi:hypothetical protein